MSIESISKRNIEEATWDEQQERKLVLHRLLLVLSLVAAGLGMVLYIYDAIGQERLELVFLEETNIDTPTLLTRVRADSDTVKVDRWIRGFVRRYMAYYFLHPDDSVDHAKKALAWLHAHSGEFGKVRHELAAHDFENFEALRKKKYIQFYALNDNTMKIRQSDDDDSLVFVEIPGTFLTAEGDKEVLFDSVLRFVVKKVPISGIDSGLGDMNVTGLQVENGSIEFIEDYTRPHEVSHLQIFKETVR